MVILPGRRIGFMGNDQYTKLLLHFDGADAESSTVDSSRSVHAVTLYGNAQLDTAQKKFGESSLLLDGIADYLSIADSDDFYFGTGDFTIDFWIRFHTGLPIQGSYMSICGQLESNAPNENVWYVKIYGGTDNTYSLRIYFGKNNNTVASFYTTYISMNINQWYHMAFVRSGLNIYIFLDGIRQSVNGLFITSDVGNIAAPLRIGNYDNNQYLYAWVDEFRISKGVARGIDQFYISETPYR